MRITAEIKDNRFYYTYEVGSSSHNGNKEITPESLVAFVNITNEMARAFDSSMKERADSFKSKAWVEQNPAEAQQILDKLKAKAKND